MTVPTLEQRFEAVIGRNDRVELRDWMPDGYRATLIGRSRSTRTPRESDLRVHFA